MPDEVGSRASVNAGGGGSATAAAASGGDWASEVAGRIEELVTTVRSQTTDRVVSVARLVVFGLLAAVMGGMALVLMVVAAVRALDELIPEGVWLTYLILGAIFTGAGLFLWSKKERPASAS